MRNETNATDPVATVERRLAALVQDGLTRREAFVEIERTTPELVRRFRKLATAQQLRDLEAGQSELVDLRVKLDANEKRTAKLEAELSALRGEPATV